MNRSLKDLPGLLIDARGTLLPVVVSAAVGSVLALALHEMHAALAIIGGAVVGAIGGACFGPRAPASFRSSSTDARIRELEGELASERTLSAAFKRQVAEREEEMQRVVGDLDMNRSVMEEQASQSIELAEELAEQKMEIERNKRHSDYLANHDLLTGLPNRRAFQDELKRRVELAPADGRAIGLFFIDLDRFKEVNDTLGHDAGDDLLRKVASILGGAMRDGDFGARLGGDEFAAIIEIAGVRDRQAAINLAERLRHALQIPVSSPKGDITVGATIGIALHPHDASGAAELLHVADQVMYAGKRRGRNRVVTVECLEEWKTAR